MRRPVWQIMLAAAVALSLIGLPAPAREVGLVTGVEGEVQATLGKSKPWHPLLGESLPDGTVVETPLGGHLKLLHLGLKQEVTILSGQRAVLTASGIEGAQFSTDAHIEDLPDSLALSAASHEQLGAVDVATIDSGAGPDRPEALGDRGGGGAGPSDVALEEQVRTGVADKVRRESEEEPERANAFAAVMSAPPAPAPVPAPAPAPAPVARSQDAPSVRSGLSSAPDRQSEIREDFIAKDGGVEKPAASDGLATHEKAQAHPMTKKPSTQNLPSGQSLTQTIRLALPGSFLGSVPQKGKPMALAFQGRPIKGKARVEGVVALATESWVLIDVDLAAWPSSSERTIEVALTLPGQAASRRLVLVRPDGAVRPGLVEAARFQGHRGFAQAAAIWLDLAASRSLSPTILDQHLQRLAAELEAGGSASPRR